MRNRSDGRVSVEYMGTAVGLEKFLYRLLAEGQIQLATCIVNQEEILLLKHVYAL